MSVTVTPSSRVAQNDDARNGGRYSGGGKTSDPVAQPSRDSNPCSDATRSEAGGERSICRAGTIQRQIIGNYELGRVLATGAFDCRTRLCTRIATGVPYVVRIYDKRVLGEAQWMWDRVAESIRVQRTLPKNKHLLEMVECFESNISVYIVMQVFPSITVTKFLTDPVARADVLRRLYAGSRATTQETAAESRHSSSKTEQATGQANELRGDQGSAHKQRALSSVRGSSPQSKFFFTPDAASPFKSFAVSRAEEDASVSGPHSSPDAHLTKNLSPHNADKRMRTSSCSPNAGDLKATHDISFEGTADANTPGSTLIPACIPFTLIRMLFEQAVYGVLHLHQHHVAHMGLAPDHLLVGPDGLLRISNMISCCFCPRSGRLHELRGTRHTVAPEVLRGESYDPYLADAWALGVVLYFMLNRGRYPHDGASTLRHVLHGRLRPSRPGIPPVALDLVSRLLQASPEERLPVEAILAHPFFSATLPTVAEEEVAEKTETTEQQTHHTAHSFDFGNMPHHQSSSEYWDGVDVSHHPKSTDDPAGGVAYAPRKGMAVSVSDNASKMEAGQSGVASGDLGEGGSMKVKKEISIRSGGDSFAVSPISGSSGFLYPSTALSMSVGLGAEPNRPRWRPQQAPSLSALEDLAARVIQYHYRKVQRRLQYRAETLALVARGQNMRQSKAEEDGISGRRKWLDQNPVTVSLALPRLPDLVSSSSVNVGGRGGPRFPVHDVLKGRLTSPANRSVTVSAENGAYSGENRSIFGGEAMTSSQINRSSYLTRTTDMSDSAARAFKSWGSLTETADSGDEHGTAASYLSGPRGVGTQLGGTEIKSDASPTASGARAGSLRGEVRLPLIPSMKQRGSMNGNVASSILVGPNGRHGGPTSPKTQSLLSPQLQRSGRSGTLVNSGDRTMLGDALTALKDSEPCPLCHREPFSRRCVVSRPYATTPFMYSGEQGFMKTPL